MNDSLDKHFFTESAKDLLKKQIGKQNFELIIAGKLPKYPFNNLPWLTSYFDEHQEYVSFKDLPFWTKTLVYPINQEGYCYFRTKRGNLTKTKL